MDDPKSPCLLYCSKQNETGMNMEAVCVTSAGPGRARRSYHSLGRKPWRERRHDTAHSTRYQLPVQPSVSNVKSECIDGECCGEKARVAAVGGRWWWG